MSQKDDNSIFEFVSEDIDNDSRIIAISREYLSLLEAGKTPDKTEFLTRFPELSVVVKECLEGIDLAFSITAPKLSVSPAIHGQPLGDFKIIKEIGRGGMATVYEAIQLSLGRRVAIKVLPFTASLDEHQRQRFQNESQAAANLHHTNIVPVYAVGCDRGMHYYAMQLIEGSSLSDWIEKMQREPGSGLSEAPPHLPEKESEWDQMTRASAEVTTLSAVTNVHSRKQRRHFRLVAKLIAQISDALDYAHSSGIVHRDIKPANLLVDTTGKPWVADFGLAQIQANSNLTMTGDLLGTLRYMSPEQANGNRSLVDHRTDIYSLGATLYELLCLKPLFQGSDRKQLYHNILFDSPQPLRQIDRAIPVELETIVMKTLSKNQLDRYNSAAELGQDLRRFLEERPILARRPTAIDHARKWIRRHPAVIVSSFIVLLLGVIGLSFSMAMISREQNNTRDALSREKTRATQAEVRLQLAQEAADDMIALAEYELSDNPFEEGLRKKLLESALVHYHAMIAQQKDDPEAQNELRKTRDRVKQIVADLTLLDADRQFLILEQSDVLSDLGATPDQLKQLDDSFESRRMKRRSAISDIEQATFSSQQEKENTIRQHLLKDAKASIEEIQQILDAKQHARLSQLLLQRQGIRAFHEATVISALKLSNEQRLAIRTIESDRRFDRRPGPGPPPFRPRGGPPESRSRSSRPEPRPWRDPLSLPKILELLTDQQRTTWNEMVGKPLSQD